MRKRPEFTTEEKKFIEAAEASQSDQKTIKEDLHKYVHRMNGPISTDVPAPSMAEGSPLRKDLTLCLSQIEWNTIDRHVKALGMQKAAWIRYAIFKRIEEEQLHFFKNQGPHRQVPPQQ